MISEFAYAAQLGLAMVYVFATLSKLRHPRAFKSAMAEYRLLPSSIVVAAAALLFVLEAVLAVSLLMGWMLDAALTLSAFTFVVFAVAGAVNLRRGRRIPCGCFGGSSETLSARSLFRLLVLIIGSLSILALHLTGIADPPTLITVMRGQGPGRAFLAESVALCLFLAAAVEWALTIPELATLTRRAASVP